MIHKVIRTGLIVVVLAALVLVVTAPVQAQDIAYVLARCKLGFTTRSAI